MARVAEGPRDGAVDDVIAEAEVVCADREHDQLDVLLLRDRRELIGLWSLSLERLAALRGTPDVGGLRSRARDVDLLVDRDARALDLGDVGAMAAVVIGAAVYAVRVVAAEDSERAARRAVGSVTCAEDVETVALPASGFAGYEAVAHRHDRGGRGRRARVGGRRRTEHSHDGQRQDGRKPRLAHLAPLQS